MNLQLITLVISFISTIILSLVIIPWLKKLKLGQVVRIDGPKEHLKKAGTPTMGGIMMLIPVAIILIIYTFKYNILVLPLIAVLGFGLVGFIDDREKLVKHNSDGISPKMKMLLLMIVTIIFIATYLYMFNLDTYMVAPFVSIPFYMPIVLFILFTGFILLATSNAVNLTDGLDGLATGVVTLIMAYFTIVAVKNGNTPMIIFGSTTVGTCLGFLIFNIKPAKVFMGDTGSLALGGAVASIAIIMKMPIYLVIVAIIPVVETLSSALQVIYFKLTKGKRLFKMAPIHHHFELCGYSERKIVAMFWSITLIMCCLAYLI